MYLPREKGLFSVGRTVICLIGVTLIVLIGAFQPFEKLLNQVVLAALGVAVLACIWSDYLYIRRLNKCLSTTENLRPLDPVTLLPGRDVFQLQLQKECRRAVRDYSPLSVIAVTLIAPHPTDRDLKLGSMSVKQLINRPGDYIYRFDEHSLILLLPSTNERVSELANRCLIALEKANLGVKTQLSVCSFQPSAKLNDSYVMNKVNELIDSKVHLTEQPISSYIEAPIDPSVLYDQ